MLALWRIVLVGFVCLGVALESAATVVVSGPDDGSAFFPLFMPTGEFDERGLSGFEFLVSSRIGSFRENDQYLISGEETDVSTSIGNDLGLVGDISGVPFNFSIRHKLQGGRNFTFTLTNSATGSSHSLCWGSNCDPTANSTEILNGIPPIHDYNGIQVQVRAQEVTGARVAVTISGLSGVDVTGEPFFDELVTPTVDGTIFAFDRGRRGQWLLGDDLDLVLREWELTGSVTLTRPDDATTDLTKVRLAVDFVRDPKLPFLVPEPSLGGSMLVSAVVLAALRRSQRSTLPRC